MIRIALIVTMRSTIAASLGIIGASFFYQNGLEWGLRLNVAILQSIVKYGIWLTPLIYIADQVRKVVKLNKEEDVVDKTLEKDEKEDYKWIDQSLCDGEALHIKF